MIERRIYPNYSFSLETIYHNVFINPISLGFSSSCFGERIAKASLDIGAISLLSRRADTTSQSICEEFTTPQSKIDEAGLFRVVQDTTNDLTMILASAASADIHGNPQARPHSESQSQASIEAGQRYKTKADAVAAGVSSCHGAKPAPMVNVPHPSNQKSLQGSKNAFQYISKCQKLEQDLEEVLKNPFIFRYVRVQAANCLVQVFAKTADCCFFRLGAVLPQVCTSWLGADRNGEPADGSE